MSDHGVITEAGAIRFERLLAAPVERVWNYLTRSELRRQWLAAGDMELRPGGAMTLVFRNSELAGEGEETPERFRQYEGIESKGRIIACEPPRLLVHSWEEGEGRESEVAFELTPRGDRTLLTLTHRRLPDRATMVDVAGGWHTHLGVLEDVLAGRSRRPFWATQAKAEKEYEERIEPAGGGLEAG
jgi:uncharacterized protein YndB with AHSA1/START domain